jgi:hypothetical protein
MVYVSRDQLTRGRELMQSMQCHNGLLRHYNLTIQQSEWNAHFWGAPPTLTHHRVITRELVDLSLWNPETGRLMFDVSLWMEAVDPFISQLQMQLLLELVESCFGVRGDVRCYRPIPILLELPWLSSTHPELLWFDGAYCSRCDHWEAFTQQSIGVVRSYRIRGEVVPTILFEMLKQFEVKVTLYT